MADPANTFTAIKPTRASSDVIAQIRQAILGGRYQAEVTVHNPLYDG